MMESLQTPFQPQDGYKYNSADYDIDRKQLAALVGLAAIFLPTIIILFVVLGETHFRNSISHYYYAQILGDIFIAVLAFIGTFLIIYKGESDRETFWASMAGIASFGVALFPTTGSGIEPGAEAKGRIFVDMANVPEQGSIQIFGDVLTISDAFYLSLISGSVHYACAFVVFAFLAYYSLFVFTRVRPDQRGNNGEPTPVKMRRNQLYALTGAIIIACIVAIGFQELFEPKWSYYNGTFIFESIALAVFGFAWLVKAKFFGYLEDT